MAQKTIILAEDDTATRRLYIQTLMASNYRVLGAADGAEALGLLERIAPDLVLLDIMMPKLDGIGACKKIRAKSGEKLPIVFLTALNELKVVRQALEAGGDDFIIKSGDLNLLLDRVRFWVGPRDQEAAMKRRMDALASLAK